MPTAKDIVEIRSPLAGLLHAALRPLGFSFAYCEADGTVLSADAEWRAWFAPLDDSVRRIHPALLPEPSHEPIDRSLDLPALAASLPGAVSRLIPFSRGGDAIVVEVACYPLELGDGSFLCAAREAIGRAADDLIRKYLGIFMDATDVGIVGARLDGTILYWNRAAEGVYGYTAGEIVGANVTTLAQPSRIHETYEALALVAQGQDVERLDTVGLTKSGEAAEVSILIKPVRDEEGNVIGSIRLIRDIGQVKESERRARMYANAVEHAPNGLLLWQHSEVDGALRLVAANPAAHRFCRLGGDAVGKTLDELLPAMPWLEAVTWDASAPHSHPQRVSGRLRIEVGEDDAREELWVELVNVRTGRTSMSTAIRDATPDVRGEEERMRLLRLLAEVEEAQRRELAEALHDDTIQVLAAAQIELGTLRRGAANDLVVTTEQVGRLEERVRRAAKSLRSVVFELYPPDLETLGLAAALSDLAEHTFGDDLEVTILDERTRPSGSAIEHAAYRILHEAMSNVRRHARARHVLLVLEHDGADLLATVTDDGVGFEPGDVRNRRGHLGMRAMFDRAASEGGSVEIRRGEPGTIVVLRLPDRELTTEAAAEIEVPATP